MLFCSFCEGVVKVFCGVYENVKSFGWWYFVIFVFLFFCLLIGELVGGGWLGFGIFFENLINGVIIKIFVEVYWFDIRWVYEE